VILLRFFLGQVDANLAVGLRAPRTSFQESHGCDKWDGQTGIIRAPQFVQHVIQHAGPKLSGYNSATTTTTVAQNATPGFLRSDGSLGFATFNPVLMVDSECFTSGLLCVGERCVPGITRLRWHCIAASQGRLSSPNQEVAAVCSFDRNVQSLMFDRRWQRNSRSGRQPSCMCFSAERKRPAFDLLQNHARILHAAGRGREWRHAL